MSEEKATQEIVYETNRDVKWLCRTLDKVKALVGDHEDGSARGKVGEEQQMHRISATIGGLVDGMVAVLVQILE